MQTLISYSSKWNEDYPRLAKGFELPMGVGITGWVALYGEPFLSSNVLEEEKYFTLDDRIHSEMAAPLIEGGRTVGALNVDSFEINAFDGNDLRLLVLMAKEASRVLENMWMIQQLRRKADQLQTLVLVGQDMSGQERVERSFKNDNKRSFTSP
jgi:GAF domain-containing protein